jgi:flagellar basal body-associated protein FliL
MVLVAIAVVAVIAVLAAVALMLLRRKKAGPDLGERKTQGPEQKPET